MTNGLVFVVDDEKNALEVLRRTLEDSYELQLFTDPKAALQAARAQMPDTVIVDYRMPGMNGIELLHELRRLDRTVSVIMITAYADGEVDRAEQVTLLYRVLAKPFEPDQIRDLVADAIRNRDLRREMSR